MTPSLVRQYLQYVAALGRTERTLVAYKQRLKQFRICLLEAGDDPANLADLTIDHFRGYQDELMERGMAVESQAAYLTTLIGFLKWCQRHGHLGVNSRWIDRVVLPKSGQPLPPMPLTLDEVVSLINTTTNLRDRAILELLYACGLRRSELLGLSIGDVDTRKQVLFVHGKGQKDRIVPIHHEALEALSRYLAQRGGRPRTKSPLFVTAHLEDAEAGTTRKRMNDNDLGRMFHQLRKRWGAMGKTRHIFPHLFRHTFACHMLQGGADLRHVQALLGHESPDTTSRYLGLVKDDLKKAYDVAVGVILALE